LEVANASFWEGSKNAKIWALKQEERLWLGHSADILSSYPGPMANRMMISVIHLSILKRSK